MFVLDEDDGAAQTGVDGGAHVADRSLVGLHPLVADHLEDEARSCDYPSRRSSRRSEDRSGSLGQLDAAGREERADPVIARLAVHVLVVVAAEIERNELLAALRGATPQEVVERLLPRGRVHLGGLSQHAVEIEQARNHAIG